MGHGVDRGYRDGDGAYQEDPREGGDGYLKSSVYRDYMGRWISF